MKSVYRTEPLIVSVKGSLLKHPIKAYNIMRVHLFSRCTYNTIGKLLLLFIIRQSHEFSCIFQLFHIWLSQYEKSTSNTKCILQPLPLNYESTAFLGAPRVINAQSMPRKAVDLWHMILHSLSYKPYT